MASLEKFVRCNLASMDGYQKHDESGKGTLSQKP